MKIRIQSALKQLGLYLVSMPIALAASVLFALIFLLLIMACFNFPIGFVLILASLAAIHRMPYRPAKQNNDTDESPPIWGSHL